MKCEYGCGKQAVHQFKNGKKCCSKSSNSCPAKKAKHDQRGEKNHRFNKDPWNKGLTKETDERVKQYGENGSKTIKEQHRVPWNKGLDITDPRVKSYAEKCSETKKGVPNYKNRKPITLNKVRSFFRAREVFRRRLYTTWIFPILSRDNFTCTKCKSKNNLEVHHVKPYRIIFDKVLLDEGIDWKQWKDWNTDIIELVEHKVVKSHKLDMGITVCKNCHSKIDKFRNSGE